MNRTVNYGKEKKKVASMIVFSLVILIVASICGLAGLFFHMDAASKASRARQREEPFDSWEDGRGVPQDAWKTREIIGLTEEFAADFKETYHYYFAFDREWYPFIIKMKGNLEEAYRPYLDYVYEDEAREPEPMKIRGVAAPIEDDIREFAIESMNLLYDDEFMTEDNFESYMGISFLDMTRKPEGRADFTVGNFFLIIGLCLGVAGAILLTVTIWGGKHLNLEEQRERETMRRMAAWQNGQEEDGCGRTDGRSAGGDRNPQTPGQPSVRQQAPSGNQAYDMNGVRLVPVKKSNVFLGIIGAVGGSLLGVVLWVGISLAGFIAGVAGFVMLKFALKGYEKLSGRLDKKGALISLVIAALMVCFANVLDYVIALCRAFFEWDASLDTVKYVIMNFGTLMTDTESWGGFMMNLVLGYGLSVWSSFSLIREILHYRER